MRLNTDRTAHRENWCRAQGLNPGALTPLAGDASFRCYFRYAPPQGQSQILMDVPPEFESCEPFINVAHYLQAQGLPVPEIHAQDVEQGFILLDDLGDQLFFNNPNYPQALNLLTQLQQISPPDNLPKFDAAFIALECEKFKTWFLEKHLAVTFSESEDQAFNHLIKLLQLNASEQPQVFIHRDYHSRNLMWAPSGQLTMIDFQDAMLGPMTYDLVSLLRDCYIAWPIDQVNTWALDYLKQIKLDIHPETWLKWFDLQGIQRHIKVCGIFCRLYYRDGKSRYLDDLSRVLNYLTTVSAKYPELNFLNQFLTQLPCGP